MDVRNSVLNLSVLKAGRLYFAEGSALDLRKAMSRGPRGPKVDFQMHLSMNFNGFKWF